jgi:putative membrane protein
MAWVRTATSLISFGFTIYKFFQQMREGQPGVGGAETIGPRGFALILIGLGLGALALATLEHRHYMKALRAEYGLHLMPRSLAMLVAGMIAGLGVLGLVAVLFRQ